MKYALALLSVGLLGTSSLSAQTHVWKKLFIYGKNLRPTSVHYPVPGRPKIGFVTTDGPAAILPELYRSTNGSSGWTHVHESVREITDMVFKDSLIGFSGNHDDLFRTLDGGASWKHIRTQGAMWLTYLPGRGRLFTSSFNERYAYRSDDNGNTWDSIITSGQTQGFAFLDENVGVLMSGMKHQPNKRTTDGGTTWIDTESDTLLQEPFVIPGTTSFIGISAYTNRMFRSDDSGRSWRIVLDFDEPVWLPHENIQGDSTVILVQCRRGIVVSYDQGRSWTLIGGPRNTYAMHPKFAYRDGIITACGQLEWEGEVVEGLYQTTLIKPTGSREKHPDADASPFKIVHSRLTTANMLAISLSHDAACDLQLIDLAGKVVAEVRSDVPTKDQQLSLPPAIANGAYILAAKTSEATVATKILIAR